MTIKFGCQTHLSQGMDVSVLAQIRASLPNVTFVRDEIFFDGVQRNGMALGQNSIDRLDAVKASGLGYLQELLWGSSALSGNVFNLPRDNTARAAFCDYSSLVCTEIKSRSIPFVGVHIWNEISGSWPGTAGTTYGALSTGARDTLSTDYITLCSAVRARLQTDHPDVLMAVGADVALQLDWLNRCIPGGVLNYGDALDLHPYAGVSNLAAVRTLMSDAGHGSMPIWITEFGAETDIADIVRTSAQCLAAGATMLSFYLAQPFGAFTVNASLMDANGLATTQGSAYNHLAGLLGSATFDQMLPTPTGVSAAKFTRSGDDITILWATTGSTPVTISGETGRENLDGTPIASASQYTASTTPFYVYGDSITIGAGIGDQVLADTQANFTLAAQGTPFYYYNRTGGPAPSQGTDVGLTPNVSSNRWDGPGSFFYIDSVFISPPASTTNKGVVRYVVPAGVTRMKVSGRTRRAQAGGDGTDIWVLHNDTIIFRRLHWPRQPVQEPILQVFDCVEGDTVEIVMGAGAAGSNAFDTESYPLTFFSTLDPVTAPDLGPVPISLYVKNQAGDVLYKIILDTSLDAVTARRNVTFVLGSAPDPT